MKRSGIMAAVVAGSDLLTGAGLPHGSLTVSLLRTASIGDGELGFPVVRRSLVVDVPRNNIGSERCQLARIDAL